MKKIVFICPYFGKFPQDVFRLWLFCCKNNPSIDWLVFTDDETNYEYPSNVFVEYTNFQDFIKQIKKKFDFNISINNPYKLCDFKPTYGFVFAEKIKGYDYWGYCDLSDCIFGNLRKFLTDDFLDSGDKLLFLGHMSLFKNSDEVNKRIFLQTKSGVNLSFILNGENRAFDELNPYSINSIYLEHGYRIGRFDQMYVDVTPISFPFKASIYNDAYEQSFAKFDPMIFEWNRGSLFECKIKHGEVSKREIAYLHFQKRKMTLKFSTPKDRFFVVPNEFVLNDQLTTDFIKRSSKKKILYLPFFKLKWKSFLYRIQHLPFVKYVRKD